MTKSSTEKILEKIRAIFENSRVKLPLELKLKTVKILLKLMNRKTSIGIFIILGWKNKWKKYTDLPDVNQDIYPKHRHNILEHYKSHKYDIETTINFDGAILIDSAGNIIHSGIIIEGLKPKVIANKTHSGHFKDLSEQFGFHEKVHSRHMAAIAASYVFKDTTTFTISEETSSLHIFECGKIVYTLKS